MLPRLLVLVLVSALTANGLYCQRRSFIPSMTSGDITAVPSAAITVSPLSCTDGSTVLTTTECTVGSTVSYCYSPPAPIQCPTGSFPGIWHPEHCASEQTCYPLNASWITTACSHGGIGYETSTLFVGTLADGETTTISGKS